eukprot:TRINITY_DN553_c0_g1_i2.p1 TRINITY_DN553_c0_g1~~TRINITY_DN553_c0_g1_i2.p1  ORF type:complete len:98 (-),score=2.41 TRINITY_DN553_c0_g1_i2:543-836(-)
MTSFSDKNMYCDVISLYMFTCLVHIWAVFAIFLAFRAYKCQDHSQTLTAHNKNSHSTNLFTAKLQLSIFFYPHSFPSTPPLTTHIYTLTRRKYFFAL